MFLFASAEMTSESSLPLHYLFDTDLECIKGVRMELLGRV